MLSFEFLLRLSAILKLDFLKSPGKSGSARPPRGMKLGNEFGGVQHVLSVCFTRIERLKTVSWTNVELHMRQTKLMN